GGWGGGGEFGSWELGLWGGGEGEFLLSYALGGFGAAPGLVEGGEAFDELAAAGGGGGHALAGQREGGEGERLGFGEFAASGEDGGEVAHRAGGVDGDAVVGRLLASQDLAEESLGVVELAAICQDASVDRAGPERDGVVLSVDHCADAVCVGEDRLGGGE